MITIGNDRLRATISPLGAEMQTLQWHGADLLWDGDAQYWSGRSPVLFPIVGRADGDVIAVNGRRAEMKQHGFARRLPFTLIDADDASCTFRLMASDETRAVYPFDFVLDLTHEIRGDQLSVRVRVQNHDDTAMPFGLGFHPAFVWPLPQAVGDHRIVLENGAEPALARLEGGLLTDLRQPSPFADGVLVLRHDQFVDDAMVFPDGAGTALTYGAEAGPRLAFRFDNLPNLALWQKPGAPFICIEPWHGMAARHGAGPEIADRPYTVVLQPDEQVEFGFSVGVIEG